MPQVLIDLDELKELKAIAETFVPDPGDEKFAAVSRAIEAARKAIDNPAAKVWVLTICHRHGDECHVHASEESAKQALDEWINEWWEVEGCGEWPDNREARMERYFEEVADESVLIFEAVINQ